MAIAGHTERRRRRGFGIAFRSAEKNMRILDDCPGGADAREFTVEFQPDDAQARERWESAADKGDHGVPHATVRWEGGRVDPAALREWDTLKDACNQVIHLLATGIGDDKDMSNLAKNLLVFTNLLLIAEHGYASLGTLRFESNDEARNRELEAGSESARKEFLANVDRAYESLENSMEAIRRRKDGKIRGRTNRIRPRGAGDVHDGRGRSGRGPFACNGRVAANRQRRHAGVQVIRLMPIPPIGARTERPLGDKARALR